jgi:hypothetical protein
VSHLWLPSTPGTLHLAAELRHQHGHFTGQASCNRTIALDNANPRRRRCRTCSTVAPTPRPPRLITVQLPDPPGDLDR